MRDIQRPLSDLLPKKETVIDAVRILTRSSETDFKILEKHINRQYIQYMEEEMRLQ